MRCVLVAATHILPSMISNNESDVDDDDNDDKKG